MKISALLTSLLVTTFMSGCDTGGTSGQGTTPVSTKAVEESTAEKVVSKPQDAPDSVMTSEKSATEAMHESSFALTPQKVADEIAVPKYESDSAPILSGMTEVATPENVQGLIDTAMGYISGNKLDLAGSVLEKLKGMKGALPESLQSQIDNLESLLASAQAMSTDIPTGSVMPMPAKMPLAMPKSSLPILGM